MSISDIIKNYEDTSVVPQTNVSGDQFGRGAVTANVAAQKQQLKQQAAVRQAATQLEGQKQQLSEAEVQADIKNREQMTDMTNQRREQKMRFESASKNILDEVKQNSAMLSEQEKIDKLEVAAAQIRLRNSRYVDELQMEGNKRRLDDALKFDAALKEAVFDEEIDMLRDSLTFQRMLDLDEASFQKELARMDVESAIALAKSAVTSANQSAIYSGAGSAITQGMGYALDKTPENSANNKKPDVIKKPGEKLASVDNAEGWSRTAGGGVRG